MNNFLKKIKYLSLVLLIKPLSVLAYNFEKDSGLSETGGNAGYVDNLQNIKPEGLIISVVNYLLSLIGVIFLILIVTAGIKWMTAAGNEDQLKKAKSTITQSLIGLAIVFLAYLISFFVVQFFTGKVFS